MAKERAIELQLIKPVIPGSPGAKGKISLRNLFKEYLTLLNVGFLDPCCEDPATCPPISAAVGNGITCNSDGLFATSAAGIETFYTGDGQLEDDRTVDADNNSIFFENVSAFTVAADAGGNSEMLRLSSTLVTIGDVSGDIGYGIGIDINLNPFRRIQIGDVAQNGATTLLQVDDLNQEVRIDGAAGTTLIADASNGNIFFPAYTGATERLVTVGTTGLLSDNIGILTASAVLDFPSTNTNLSADLTIAVAGAALGDTVSLGVPNASVNANSCFTAWVSATNTVTVRFNNYSAGTIDPASGTFKVLVHKF